MNKLKSLTLALILGCGVNVMAQNESGTMSLKQAVDYALKNNPTLKNAKVDVEISRKKVKEITSMGLPKISASFDYTSQPLIPTTVVPNFINPNDPPLEFQMGISHAGAAKITANWLLVDGTYFLGLKAAKQYVELASRVRASTEIDTRMNVSQAYFMALVADQTIIMMDSNKVMLQKTYDDVNALFENGFSEKIDVSRLALQLNNLNVQRQQVENQRQYAYRILKFQMGMDVDKPLILSDKLVVLMAAGTMDTSTQANMINRPEFQILTQTQVLNDLNVQRYQMGYLPSLSGFISHQQNTYATKNNFSDLGNKYYGGTMWGLSLKVPIFSGFERSAQIQQARLETLKTRNDLNNLENLIDNDVFNSRNTYVTALQTVDNQKLNYDLSLEIREIATTKYEEGVGTSLELTTANNDLLQAETNYLSSIYELLVAEIQYKKALGTFK